MSSSKNLFDQVSKDTSKIITTSYSTSFSFAIQLLDRRLREHIYSIYGYVRLGDEIVDSFHEFNKEDLMKEFRQITEDSIKYKISLNPILNNFQYTVNKYKIKWELINKFIESMEFDLKKKKYDEDAYKEYIKGSAEYVGLMCLAVFCNNKKGLYEKLKPHAIALGSAFQKINFLRDMNTDYKLLGRVYFPNLDINKFNDEEKMAIELDIKKDFEYALEGIKKLPESSKRAVYLAYTYYWELLNKIIKVTPQRLLTKRIRISNFRKILLILKTYLKLPFLK